MTTEQIVKKAEPSPLHVRRDPGLMDEMISSVSRWRDTRWIFDLQSHGQRKYVRTIHWEFELPDSTLFTDPCWADLLDVTKRFVWSMKVAPGDGAVPMASGSSSILNTGLRFFIRWMVRNGYRQFDEIDAIALDNYRNSIVQLFLDEGNTIDNAMPLRSRCRIPFLLWRQRHALSAAGVPGLPERPWPGSTAFELAQSIGVRVDNQILPIPDDVAIPLLNAAHRFIHTPADDVIRLTEDFMAIRKQVLSKTEEYRRRQALSHDFEVSTVPGEDRPWRTPIASYTLDPGADSADTRQDTRILRRLITDVRSAATVVIQATTGMRVSEMAGLEAGINEETGLPCCVEIVDSPTGLYELFLIRGDLSKGEDEPRPVEWVLGMRLKGTDDIPPPVCAVLVVDRLFATWRKMAKTKDLFVSFTNTSGLPRIQNSVGPIGTDQLSDCIKDFIERHIDLSGLPDTSLRSLEPNNLVEWRETKGRCFRSHMFRKTLAHFIFNTDNRLIPAISQQFQHISMAMTEYGYLGRNQALFDTMDSVRAQETAALLYESAMGKPLAGRMGNSIEEHIAEIKKAIEGLPKSEAWKTTLNIVLDDGIRLWFAPHGKCMPGNPANMLCHEMAGTPSWRNKEPNYEAREPSLCAGCGCFVVDEQHIPFWERRFVENWAAYKHAESQGFASEFRVVRKRAEQAKALLQKLNVNVEPLEMKAEKDALYAA